MNVSISYFNLCLYLFMRLKFVYFVFIAVEKELFGRTIGRTIASSRRQFPVSSDDQNSAIDYDAIDFGGLIRDTLALLRSEEDKKTYIESLTRNALELLRSEEDKSTYQELLQRHLKNAECKLV